MYDLNTIHSMNEETGETAKEYGLTPMFFSDRKDFEENVCHIPNLGDYRPEGYKLEKTFFVDSSGFGAPYEPALTFDQFLDEGWLSPEYGYAIVAEGQFQVYIGAFKKLD